MQSYQCNLCLLPLKLFSERPTPGTPNAYLSECLKHIFCEPCKNKIYPKCICRPQSRFMAINKQMPERFRSIFHPVQDIVQRMQQIQQFQAKQNHINFQRMCQQHQRVAKMINQIDQHGANEQIEKELYYLDRGKKLYYLKRRVEEQR